jgi:hypothetical protein
MLAVQGDRGRLVEGSGIVLGGRADGRTGPVIWGGGGVRIGGCARLICNQPKANLMAALEQSLAGKYDSC